MPISLENKRRYGPRWKHISRRIRFTRAKGRCEFCRIAVHGDPHPVTGSRVVLTVAHLDHTPENNDPRNLAAMCQRCHLTYDAQLHAGNAAETRRAKADEQAGQGRLPFGVPA
jgi:hypothetical protein